MLVRWNLFRRTDWRRQIPANSLQLGSSSREEPDWGLPSVGLPEISAFEFWLVQPGLNCSSHLVNCFWRPLLYRLFSYHQLAAQHEQAREPEDADQRGNPRCIDQH